MWQKGNHARTSSLYELNQIVAEKQQSEIGQTNRHDNFSKMTDGFSQYRVKSDKLAEAEKSISFSGIDIDYWTLKDLKFAFSILGSDAHDDLNDIASETGPRDSGAKGVDPKHLKQLFQMNGMDKENPIIF